jgi:hypothetical protein
MDIDVVVPQGFAPEVAVTDVLETKQNHSTAVAVNGRHSLMWSVLSSNWQGYEY